MRKEKGKREKEEVEGKGEGKGRGRGKRKEGRREESRESVICEASRSQSALPGFENMEIGMGNLDYDIFDPRL